MRPCSGTERRAVGRARTQQIVNVRDVSRSSMVTIARCILNWWTRRRQVISSSLRQQGSSEFAVFGDILAAKAKEHGVVGVATDGHTARRCLYRKNQSAVVSTGVTMVPQGFGGYSVQSVNQTVTCGGVEVNPGDLIVRGRRRSDCRAVG